MPAFFRDDSSQTLVDAAGLVSTFTAAGTAQLTSSVAVQEIVLGADFLAAVSKSQAGQQVLVRLASGAADVLYAFGPSGASGSYSSANMALLPQRWVEYTTITPSSHKSLYVLQDSVAGRFQAMVLR